MSDVSCLLGQIWRNFDEASDTTNCTSLVMLNMRDDDTDVSVSTSNTQMVNKPPSLHHSSSTILHPSPLPPNPTTEPIEEDEFISPEIDLSLVEQNITDADPVIPETVSEVKTEECVFYITKIQEDILIKILNSNHLQHMQILIRPDKEKQNGVKEATDEWKRLASKHPDSLWLIRKSKTASDCFVKCYSPGFCSDVPIDRIEDWVSTRDHRRIYDFKRLHTFHDLAKESIAFLIVYNSKDSDAKKMWKECTKYKKYWCYYSNELRDEVDTLFHKDLPESDCLLIISSESVLMLTTHENIDNMIQYIAS